jgi:hypothetical protein
VVSDHSLKLVFDYSWSDVNLLHSVSLFSVGTLLFLMKLVFRSLSLLTFRHLLIVNNPVWSSCCSPVVGVVEKCVRAGVVQLVWSSARVRAPWGGGRLGRLEEACWVVYSLALALALAFSLSLAPEGSRPRHDAAQGRAPVAPPE